MDEPITLSEAKAHLRVDGTADDAAIGGYISTAREWVEGATGVLLAEREVTEILRGFGPAMAVRARPIAPDQPILVTYRDRDGADRVIDGARILYGAEIVAAAPAPRLIPAVGARWPGAWGGDPVSVIFTAGIADPAAIPPILKQAMLILITAYEADREGGEMLTKAEAAARRLCRRYIRKVL